MGDPDVKLKRKVQLRKKVEEPEVDKSNKWIRKILKNKIFWIFVFVVICVLGYFIFTKSEDKTAQGSEKPGIETVGEPNESTDSLTNTIEGNEVVSTDKEDEAITEADNQDVKEDVTPITIGETPTPSATSTSTSTNVANVSDNVEAEAMKVIRGDYGDGQERKDKLGTKYQTIQSRVNELKREGIF